MSRQPSKFVDTRNGHYSTQTALTNLKKANTIYLLYERPSSFHMSKDCQRSYGTPWNNKGLSHYSNHTITSDNCCRFRKIHRNKGTLVALFTGLHAKGWTVAVRMWERPSGLWNRRSRSTLDQAVLPPKSHSTYTGTTLDIRSKWRCYTMKIVG